METKRRADRRRHADGEQYGIDEAGAGERRGGGSHGGTPREFGLEQFQQKCEAVLRPELRKIKETEHFVIRRKTKCFSERKSGSRHRARSPHRHRCRRSGRGASR
ncbi:hypothetical protein EOS93_19860 [Rhizobium sp. RMa-01]|nr:hypothetical protein EOS93_19860 [Rhizobium sp. RMa-01]